jgi:hypothetical protein
MYRTVSVSAYVRLYPNLCRYMPVFATQRPPWYRHMPDCSSAAQGTAATDYLTLPDLQHISVWLAVVTQPWVA